MDRNQIFPLEKVKSMVDLGVHFDNSLTFRGHISEEINKAYSVLGIIKRNFIYMDERTFVLLYTSMVLRKKITKLTVSYILLKEISYIRMNALLYYFIRQWYARMLNLQIRFGACIR